MIIYIITKITVKGIFLKIHRIYIKTKTQNLYYKSSSGQLRTVLTKSSWLRPTNIQTIARREHIVNSDTDSLITHINWCHCLSCDVHERRFVREWSDLLVIDSTPPNKFWPFNRRQKCHEDVACVFYYSNRAQPSIHVSIQCVLTNSQLARDSFTQRVFYENAWVGNETGACLRCSIGH